MRIAFNPSTVAALTSPPNNKDITFDLRGQNIFARGVKFYGTDTNTWRDIKINNVSIGSHTLDLRNGSTTTLTNTNGVVTINSTWRPVVDNLTSNSATSSLSANQGRVLAGLINGKSDSDHNHDGRYLKLTGGTLMGNLIGTSAMFSGRFYGNGDDEGIIIKPSSNGFAGLILGTHDGERSIFYFVKNKPFWRYSHGSDNLDIIHPKKSGTIALTSDIPSSVKNPYSLTTFGVVYDGSAEKVVSPSNFISQLEEGTSVVTDGTMFVTSWASDKGFADTNAVNVPYKRKAASLWDYIKAKTDSLYATKNHNHDDRYLKLTGGVLKGQIILPDIDVNTSYTGSIIIGASNTDNLGIDGNEIMARNNGKASTLYLNNEGGAVQLGAILRTNSNIAYIGSQSTQNMIKFINNTSDSHGNGIAIGGGGLTIIGSGESSDVVMGQHSSGGDENMIIAGDGNIDFYSNLKDGWKYGKHMWLDTNGFLITPSYIHIGGNENNNSSPDRVWGSNSSDSYLRSYRTSALSVANANTVDGYHYNDFTYKKYIGYNRNGPYNIKVFSMDTSSLTWGAYYLIFDIFSSGYSGNRVYFGRYEVSLGHWNNTDKNPTVYSRWIFKTNSAYDCVHVVKDLSSYKVDVYIENNLWDCSMGLSIVAIDGFKMVSSNSWVNLPSASSTVQLIGTTYLSFIGNATSATKVIVNQHTNNDTNYPLVWSNQANTSSVTENQLFKSWADLYYNPKHKSLTVGGHFEGPWGRFTNQNGALIIGDYANARISAIGDQVVFNTGAALRFGGTDWEYSDWAGLKYDTTANTIYLGIAEGTVFNYHSSKRSNGIFKLPGITTITPDRGARIGNTGGNLYLGNSNNSAWVKVQDMCSQSNTNNWRIYQDGSALFRRTLRAGQLIREGSGQLWVNGRNGALLRETSVAGYHTLWSLKTTDGSWDFGEYNAGSAWNNIPVLTYITDSDYNSGNNRDTYQIKFPLASGTVALTSQASSFDVNTAQYLRSLGNQNCQTGRTQNYGDVYTYNTYTGNTGSPTTYTSVIGFGRGIAGTVEIAGGWSNTNLYWRSLRDCCEDWHSWRTVLDSNNYTDFIGSYYWANVKISTTSSTATSPTVHTLTATRVCAGHDPGIDNSISCSNWFRSSGNTGWYNSTYYGGWYMSDNSWIRAYNGVGIYTGGQIYSDSSIRMSSIRLERTNEINSSDNLFINYGSSTNVSLCQGGGNVGIGTLIPTQKLDVCGNIITKGFGIQPYYLSESVLLPTISPGDGYTYRCLEISATTEISCIIADRAGLMDQRGILIKFNQGFDGQVILLKDLDFGTGNGFFCVQPYGCRIIKANSHGTFINYSQISDKYNDGGSRFFVYVTNYNAWLEFSLQ